MDAAQETKWKIWLKIVLGSLALALLVLLLVPMDDALQMWVSVMSLALAAVSATLLIGIGLLRRIAACRDFLHRLQRQQLESVVTIFTEKDDASYEKILDSDVTLCDPSARYRFYGQLATEAREPGLFALNWLLRERLEREVPKQLSEYSISFPAPTAATDVDALRADVRRLLCLVTGTWQRKYRNETMRALLASSTAVMTFLITMSFLSWLTIGLLCQNMSSFIRPPSVLVAAMFAGTLGGFVSVQRRLHGSSADAIPLADSPLLAITSIVTAPVLGAIGALLVYVLLSGSLVSGVLFPNFKSEASRTKEVSLSAAEIGGGDTAAAAKKIDEDAAKVTKSASFIRPKRDVTFATYVMSDSVVGNADLAKLLFWCFVAGFLERFVPDTISNIVGRANDPGKSGS